MSEPPKALRTRGVLLFLFIPLVLYLFTVQPEPLAFSLALGVVLMLGHRFLARPYMERARPWKCLWCNRRLSDSGAADTVQLLPRSGPLEARCCPGHGGPTLRFFIFVERWRLLLALGIFGPLLLLLGTLAAVAAGWEGGRGTIATATMLTRVTAIFQLVIGLTVNVAAFGYLTVTPVATVPPVTTVAPADAEASGMPRHEPVRVPFPVHNFFLLGVRPLLWIFRIVGFWWIVRGSWTLLAGS